MVEELGLIKLYRTALFSAQITDCSFRMRQSIRCLVRTGCSSSTTSQFEIHLFESEEDPAISPQEILQDSLALFGTVLKSHSPVRLVIFNLLGIANNLVSALKSATMTVVVRIRHSNTISEVELAENIVQIIDNNIDAAFRGIKFMLNG
ncbi:hypothetical protein Tco_0273913 [Tanacetum coccineum]